MRKNSFCKSGLLRFALNDRGFVAMMMLLFMLAPVSLHAQDSDQQNKNAEPTIITIINARQTTYDKDEKNGNDSIVLEGAVEISVKKGSSVSEIKADRVTYDRSTEMLYAEGSVEILTKSSGSGGGETTTASSLLMNTSTLEGIFDDGRVVQTKSDALNLPSGSTLIVFSDIFGKGENNTIAFKNSSLTFCDAPEPHWHIDASRTWLLPGGEFAFLNALLYVGPVPVLYFPAFYYPKDELIFNPVFGSRLREGKYVQTTTYLMGRKPLSSGSSSSSSSSSSGSNKNEDSSTEESLKAVYNFMKPTELKEQERQGLMLHNLDESYKGDTSSYIKLIGDWYTNLGTVVGLDGKLRPSKEYVTNLDFNFLAGFSSTVFVEDNNYSFLSAKGNRYMDGSNFLGIKMPFRYGTSIDFTLSKPFRLSLSLPLYSDPFFYNDFKNREESMEWISYLLDLSNKTDKDEGATEKDVAPKPISQLQWKLSSSYSPNLPSFFKPYLSSISLSLNSSIYINSLQMDEEALKADARYKKDKAWKDYTPERSFYYPSQITPVTGSVAVSGVLFQWPLSPKSVSQKQVNYPLALTKPDELKTEKQLEAERLAAEKEAAGDSETEIEEDEIEDLEDSEAEETLPMPKPVLTELDTSSLSAVTISGLNYKLDYNVNANLNTQITYSTTDSKKKKYLKTPDDFDWNNIQSSMYSLKLPVSVNSSLGYGGSFFSMKNSLAYDPSWQEHPDLRGYSKTEQQNIIKADLASMGLSVTNNNSVSIRPFAYIPTFAETGLSWSNTMKLYRKKFTGTADKPEWEIKKLDMEDPESVTANSLTFTFGMSELNSTFKQSISVSSTLKPLTAKYTGTLNLTFPFVTFSLSTGVYEKSKNDPTLLYNPLTQSLSINLFNSTLKISESITYTYKGNKENSTKTKITTTGIITANPNSEKDTKNEKHMDSLKINLSYKQLAIAFTSSYTQKYDLFIDTPSESGKKGYVLRKDKEFVPYSASLSYSLPSTTHYNWHNRITWTPGLSTNINYDFIKPTNSYFQLSSSLSFNINNFLKLTFSATSRNSSIYWYFNNTGKYTGNAFYGNNFASRMAADLIQSFGIYGVNGWGWKNDTFKKNREASGFKLKSLNLTVTHQLHDWDFNMTWKFEPKIVKKNNIQKYVFDPYISIGIVWNPMQSIKSNLTYEYKEADDEAIWILK